MASKNKKSNEDEMKREQKLQAILLADSFSKSFRPITLESPKVLLPLMNIPMLEYTIEFLAQNGVEELFVFCVWHAEMLQAYIKQSKWPDLIAVHCISSTTCSSAGDALRELDSMGVIRSDPFILISGDVISNMNLESAIKFHKEKKKEDSNTVMTLVMKTVQQSAGIQPVMSDLVVGMDSSTSQILWFDEDTKSGNMSIPVEILSEHPHLDISSNLLDCHIDICSPELMLQFSDNFDYQDIRNDFIRNEAVNWELGMHIYGYLLDNDYAARVQDPGTYHHICRDIVSRWAYPIVSDAQLLQDSSYAHGRGGVYKEDSVRVARSADVKGGVVIGRWSSVGNHSKLLRSSIGRRCKIGTNVTVVDSHLWDDVIIEDNAVIHSSVVCSGAIVKKNAKISRGCILSYGTVVGEGIELPSFTRLTLRDGMKEGSSSAGTGSKGSPWKFESSGDYDDFSFDSEGLDEGEDVGRLLLQLLRAQSMGNHDEILEKVTRWGHVPEPEPDTDDIGQDDYEDNGDEFNLHAGEGTQVFGKNVCDMVVTGYAEGHPADNVLMEIKGYKFSQNKSFQNCLAGAFPGLTTIILQKGTSKNLLLSFAKTFFQSSNWGHMMLKSLLQTSDDEVCLIQCLEMEAIMEDRLILSECFRFLLQILYDSELIGEDALLKWIAFRRQADESNKFFGLFQRPDVQQFVEWIESNDDDSDDEDGEDEDEDDEEK